MNTFPYFSDSIVTVKFETELFRHVPLNICDAIIEKILSTVATSTTDTHTGDFMPKTWCM